MALIEQRIGFGHDGQHRRFFFAGKCAQGKRPALHAEQGAVAAYFVHEVVEAPGADFFDLLEQCLQWQGVFAVA